MGALGKPAGQVPGEAEGGLQMVVQEDSTLLVDQVMEMELQED